MIQINEKSSENIVNFPKNQNLTGNLVLKLHSEITQKTYSFNVVDEGSSKRYYKFTLDFSEVDNGEYDYSINDLETGLIRIGMVESSTPELVEYVDEYNIIQYGEDRSSYYRLQNKEVTYTENGENLVTADPEYYGLKNVVVNVEVPVDEYYAEGYTSGITDGYVSGRTDGYASGYTEGYSSGNTDGYVSGYTIGYESGHTDGVAEQKAKLIGLDINSNGTYSRPDGWSAVTVNVPTGSTINNQNKTVNIVNNGVTTVTYDSGYTGLGTVGINVAVPTGHSDAELIQAYQSGYTNGYTSGNTDGYNSGKIVGYNSGITYQKSLLVSTAVTENGTYTREDGFNSVNVEVPDTSGISYYQVSVVISSNNPTYLVNNAVVYLTNTEQSLSQVYTGSTIVFNGIIPGLNYTVSFGGVSGYTAPDAVSGTSSWGGSSSVSGYYEYTVSPSGYTNQYFTIEAISGGTLSFVGYTNIKSGKYSLNDGSWTDFLFNSTQSDLTISTLSMSAGDKVRIKMNEFPDYYARFVGINGLIVNVYGNIMSLGYGDNFETATTMTGNYGYLFDANNKNKILNIVNAANLILPATTLVNGAYDGMFRYKTSLVAAPELPATTLTNSCYGFMFYGCTSLVTAPALPATSIPYEAYKSMFAGCTSLVNAPALPATTFTGGGVYTDMFNGCTSLVTAPDLPALEINSSTSYNQMFYGCSSLNYIKCLATNSTTVTPYNWVSGVSPTGTFVKKSGASWSTGTDGIPTGWTVIEE